MSRSKNSSGYPVIIHEIAGSFGNFGTVIPIILGVALTSDVNLGCIFLFFGLWYIIMGMYYRIPMSFEPMKAIGAVVIAEGLKSSEVTASGIVLSHLSWPGTF